MKKIYFLAAIFLGVAFWFFARAANPFDIQFPVPELGNCGSVEECKSYCDSPSNLEACASWAKSNGLSKDVPSGSAIPESGGPGGCKGENECESYCNDPVHSEECMNFAVENGMMSREEVEIIKKDMNKTGPGGCKSREECDSFCSGPENSEACMQFAVSEGMLSQEEADFMLERMRSGGMGRSGEKGRPSGPKVGHQKPGPRIDQKRAEELINKPDFKGPGGCKTDQECENYCDNPDNGEECINFAAENGLMPKEDAEKFIKISRGGGPGGCRGPKECDAFCDISENREVCLNFAVENGLMPPEEIEQAKKFMEIEKRGGPGGCKGQEECDAYCSQPEHGDECFSFAKDNGLMPPEEIQQMEKQMTIMKKMQKGEMNGPGGCKTKEDCSSYCGQDEHLEECMNFSGNQGIRNRAEVEKKMRDFKKMEEMGREFQEKWMMQGLSPEGLPGQDMMSPKGEFRPPEGFDGHSPENMTPPDGSEGKLPEGLPGQGMMPEGFRPPEGTMNSEGFRPPEGFEGRPPEGYETMPPEGIFRAPESFVPPEFSEGVPTPPGEMMIPREGFTSPETQNFTPPSFTSPPETFSPSPETTPLSPPPELPPTTFFGPTSVLGIILEPFLGLLRSK